ncbi:tRNA adenosine(34) deaminase TadA [Calycomorphotria hydatis]|uniref:tRNA-specific adenosine deaminase n=1 Tax=Calycomorphotria hydatis TaxID=2528027 RepID=A0A517T871_9PLAN|nr:tRNA adenosine(34) deaminase TadA [Calycomorphotria hydatis]QDT64579.1 tRNA-specific adenosine deaminase [Calycomorphotria hydatis]
MIAEADSPPPNPLSPHEAWMRKALDQAIRAFDEDEVPVGAIVVQGNPLLDGKVIGEGYNQREQLNDPTAHAEMIAITQAAEAMGSWRLENCTLYVTLEPCPMCAGAIVQARIPTVIYGTDDPKAGACQSLYQITDDNRLNHRCTVLPGVLADDAKALLQEFFRQKRAMGKK